MQNLSLNHLALAVKDVTVSVAFYQAVFGLREIENTASNSATRWLSLGEGKELHLIPRREAEIKTNKAVHFALATPRFDAFIQQLIKLEIPYSDWPNSPNKDYVRNDVVNKEKLRIFAEVGFGLGAINYDADTGSLRNVQHENLSGGISILNLGLGGNYFFNEKFGLELIIPYLSAKNITSENSNNLYSGIGPTIGLTYVLN